MEDRMIKIEEQLLLVQRQVEQLDGLVRELFESMEGMRVEVTRLRDDTRREIDDLTRSPEDDRPPHW